MSETDKTSYVLGTDQDEMERLFLQHTLWSKVTHETWKKAGVKQGSKVIDLGAGPGFCTMDLAKLVGPKGHVAALERSKNYLEYSKQTLKPVLHENVSIHDVDLSTDELPVKGFDVSWCRWVCSFLKNPERLVENLTQALKPDGTAVFYEYLDYASWRMLPHESMVTQFVERVMSSWRASGGEPDIAPRVVAALEANHFRIVSIEPKVWCVKPGDDFWMWIASYMRVNTRRSLQDQSTTKEWAGRFMDMLERAEREQNRYMTTPMLVEIIAQRS